MMGDRYLIVNADDFGQSSGINRGVVRAHEHGMVTSASLMVRWAAAMEAAEYARKSRNLSVGLHLDLGEWVCRDSSWVPLYQVVPIDDAVAVQREVSSQLAAFRDLTGCEPSHIDSHQHVHLREPVRAAALEAARRIDVPLRDCSPEVRYCGQFYGQTAEGSPYPEGITANALLKILAELQPGFTELGCHPGECEDLETTYVRERIEEVKVLCDERVRFAFAEMGIRLCSFTDVPALRSLQGTSDA